MPLLRNRWFLGLAFAAVAVPGAWLLAKDTGSSDPTIAARVKRGEFVVTVSTSGELSARESVKITAPGNTRQAQIYQMKIASIVPEGTHRDRRF